MKSTLNDNSDLKHFYLIPHPKTNEELVNRLHEEFLEEEGKRDFEFYKNYEEQKFYDDIHNKLEKIPKIVVDSDDKKTLSNIRLPPGFGKTFSMAKGSIKQGRFIGIYERHNVAEEFSSKFNLKHIKGFKRMHSSHFDKDGNIIPPECEEIDCSPTDKYRFPMGLIKAEHRKKMKERDKDCPYFTQYENLENNDNLAMIHEHMKTKQFKKIVNMGNEPTIVNIDENFISSFTNEVNITINKLKGLDNELYRMILLYDIIVREEFDPEYPKVPMPLYEIVVRLIVVIRALISTMQDMDESVCGGNGRLPNSSFIPKSLNEKIPDYLAKNSDINEGYRRLSGAPTKGNNIKSILGIINMKNKKGGRIWEYPYYKLLKYHYLNLPREEWFHNILEEVVKLAEYSAEYLDKDDVNLPFTPIYKEENEFVKKSIKWKHIDFEELKNCFDLDAFVIITDATTTSNMYRLLAEKIGFGFENLTYLLDVPDYNRNIFQTTDGFYYIESFENAFDKLISLIEKIIKFHIKEGFVDNEHKANIICLQRFENRVKEELFRRGINLNLVRINHYWNLRGVNYMKNDYLIIFLGIPEPNFLEMWMEAKAWHIGEEKISIERREEPRKGRYNKGDYYYLDDRLRKFVEMKRENELEQDIERVRFFLGDANKFAYALTALPISYKTEKLTCNESSCMIDVMNELRNNSMTITELNKKVKVDYRTLKIVVEYLERIGWINETRKDEGRSHKKILTRAKKLTRIGQ